MTIAFVFEWHGHRRCQHTNSHTFDLRILFVCSKWLSKLIPHRYKRKPIRLYGQRCRAAEQHLSDLSVSVVNICCVNRLFSTPSSEIQFYLKEIHRFIALFKYPKRLTREIDWQTPEINSHLYRAMNKSNRFEWCERDVSIIGLLLSQLAV